MNGEHQLVGGVVIVAVILAALIGVFLIYEQPYGRAFQGLEQTECLCRMNGFSQAVLYSDSGFVLMPDGNVRNIGIANPSLDKCSQVCAMIGGHK